MRAIYPGLIQEEEECDYECCLEQTAQLAGIITPTSSIMIAITLLILCFMMFITYKITRLVWPREKGIVSMLYMLCLTVASLVIYWSFNISDMRNPDWACNDESVQSYVCAQSFVVEMPAFLLANAVTLNLNKWIYFKLRINAFIKVGFGDNIDVIDNIET